MRTRPSSSQSGFTLVELLVTIAMLSILALLSYPSLQRMILRSKLQGTTTEVAIMMQRMRFEAIRRGAPAVVEYDPVDNLIRAYIDLNDAGGNPASDLIYNPQLSGGPANPTDDLLGRISLATGIELRAPPPQLPIDALTTAPGPGNVAVFDPDGSARDLGAFRFADIRDNYLEVRIEPAATARVQQRKWEDFGGGFDWYGPGDTNHPWKWKT